VVGGGLDAVYTDSSAPDEGVVGTLWDCALKLHHSRQAHRQVSGSPPLLKNHTCLHVNLISSHNIAIQTPCTVALKARV
jgi:hypothetical protein